MAHNATLRYLDDVLERLEQLNLNEVTDLPDGLARELVMLGIDRPHAITISELIERVWTLQEPHLTEVAIITQPRKRRPRKESASEAA